MRWNLQLQWMDVLGRTFVSTCIPVSHYFLMLVKEKTSGAGIILCITKSTYKHALNQTHITDEIV